MAFAGELPGCAAVGDDSAAAVARIPARVTAFVAWLRAAGEPLTEPVGNWYEVERAAATSAPDGGLHRAVFSLDELPPSADEFETWLRWAELAREDLAGALDDEPAAAEHLAWLPIQDAALAVELGSAPTAAGDGGSALNRLYESRDTLTAALIATGPAGAGVRRALRLAIADDLRAVELISHR